jgi:hypothetical protein
MLAPRALPAAVEWQWAMSMYEAAWLRRAELFSFFESTGLVERDAQVWLARAIEDRGIVYDRQAVADTDLFRLNRIVPARRGIRWTPDPSTVDWTDLSIDAPDRLRRIPTRATIEVSAGLLRRLMQASVQPNQGRRRGKKPTKRAEVVARIRADIEHGNRAEEEIRGMKETALADSYRVSRDTARRARIEALREIRKVDK